MFSTGAGTEHFDFSVIPETLTIMRMVEADLLDALDNTRRHREGLPRIGLVDRERGYRVCRITRLSSSMP